MLVEMEINHSWAYICQLDLRMGRSKESSLRILLESNSHKYHYQLSQHKLGHKSNQGNKYIDKRMLMLKW